MVGAYLIDSVTLRLDKGSDKWQEPAAPEDIPLKVFIDYGERKVENAQGEMVVSMAKVLMRPRTIITTGFATRAAKTISYKDRIIFDGKEHAIVRIKPIRDFRIRGLEVYVA